MKGTSSPPSVRALAALLIVELALNLAGCSSPPKATEVQAPSPGNSLPGDEPQADRPSDFDAYFTQMMKTIALAEGALTQECMQAKGFRFFTDGDSQPASAAISKVIDVALADDVQARSTDGYRYWTIADLIERTLRREDPGNLDEAARRTDAEFRKLSAEDQRRWTSALYGDDGPDSTVATSNAAGARISTGKSGCIARSRERVWGSLKRFVDVKLTVQTLHLGLIDATDSDPAIVELYRRWSRCMADRGFAFSNRGDAEGAALQQYVHGFSVAAKARELAIAAADAECGSSVRYGVELPSLTSQAHARFGAANEADISAVTAELEYVARRAGSAP